MMLRRFIIGAFAIVVMCGQTVLPGFPPGTFQSRGAIDAVAYAGPGDITTFLHWYGLRAYNKAYATALNPLADIVDTTTGLATCTIKTNAAGNADLTSVACPTASPTVSVTTFCTVTHAGCSVTKLYDQVGSVSAVQATLAKMPTLVFNVTGGNPAMLFTRTSAQFLQATSTGSLAQPYSISSVSRRPTAGNKNDVFGDGASGTGNIGLGYSATTNVVDCYAPTDQVVVGVSDASFHAIQMVANAGSGNIYVDGTSNVSSLGSSAMLNTNWNIGNDAFGDLMDGYITEAGFASGAFTVTGSGVASQLNANQRAYWGF